MVTTARTKISVRPASKTESASSFGVFWRDAPSTSAIMRSRKLDPCSAVMRTLILSDRTLVPPVTARRSPPASRMTGADFAGDRRFVDRRHSLDDLAVARHDIAGLDQHQLPHLEGMGPARARRDRRLRPAAAWRSSRSAHAAQRGGAAPCRAPRPPLRRRWQNAAPVTQSQPTIWISKPTPAPRKAMSRTVQGWSRPPPPARR